ncbi:hypothetical protein B6S44_19440 [Bosea sp. Tri-44]|nr:hypothetical protein B6S44_19440 [Bosea sp. Tri-44]
MVACWIVYFFPLPAPFAIDPGLTGNFFTESCGIALTVVLLERLLRSEESLRNQRALRLANSEFTLIFNRCVDLWATFADAVADKDGAVPIFDPSVPRRMRSTNIFGPAHVHPVRPINVYASQQLKQLEKFIQQAMLRYFQSADMETLEALQKIERSVFLHMAELATVIAEGSRERGQFPGFAAPDDQLEEILPIEQFRQAINLSRARLAPPEPPLSPPMLRFRQPRVGNGGRAN